MKKTVAIILCVAVLMCSMPLSIGAQAVPQTTANLGKVYLSDVFYGYSDYLYNGYILDFSGDCMQPFNNIMSDYVTTDDFAIALAADNITSLLDLRSVTEMVLDRFAGSSFKYNEQLDTANEKFAEEVLQADLENSSDIHSDAKLAKNMKTAFSVISSFADLKKFDDREVAFLKDKQNCIDWLDDWWKMEDTDFPEMSRYRTSINSYVSEAFSKGGKTLKHIKTTLNFFESLTLAVAMANANLEMVQAIIDTQPSSSALYKGMTRLKGQLENGYLSYFANNFIQDEAIDFIFDKAGDLITAAESGAAITSFAGSVLAVISAVVNLVNDVVLKWICKIDIGDYQTAVILGQYCRDMETSIENRVLAFRNRFDLSDISDFETMIDAYFATGACALNACENLANSNDRDDKTYGKAYLAARAAQLSAYTYKEYINYTKNYIRALPAENRELTDHGTWDVVNGTIFASATDDMEDGYLYFPAEGFRCNLNLSSTTVSDNLPLTVLGNVTVTAYAVFRNDGDFTVNGSVDNGGRGGGGRIENYGKLTVTGDLYNYYSSTYNYGQLEVRGNLNKYNGDLYQNEPDAVLRLGGNIGSGYGGVHIDVGTLILNGTAQQVLHNLYVKDLDVQNPAGVRYESDIHIYGHYALNGNPVDSNGYNACLHDGASLDSVSNYGRISITGGGVTLSSCTLDYLLLNGAYKLIIPETAAVTVNGSVDNGSQRGGGIIENYGKLTVTGDLRNYYSSTYNYGQLEVRGNLSRYSGNLYINAGALILNGTAKQTVDGLNATTIEILNGSEEGVEFKTAIYPSVLFDHHGNVFTCPAGSTFPDYDGDGLKDNVDPQPTVGDPCVICFVSEDTEKGTVSEDRIETIGGTKYTVTATPTFRYDFDHWENASGTVIGTDSVLTYVARGNDTATAVFAKRRQPIETVTAGGVINAPADAAIESAVSVSVTEDEGYIYTENSLCYNGIPVEGNRFIMPDEPVTLTAEFLRNDAYFALKEVLSAAKAYTYEDYDAASFAALTAAIGSADATLLNHISAEDSRFHIAALQEAMAHLQSKYIVSVRLSAPPVLYYGVEDMANDIALTVTYDNGTTAGIRGADCTLTGFDSRVYGEQTVTVEYAGFTDAIALTVFPRPLADCDISPIAAQIFKNDGTQFTPPLTVCYPATGEELIAGVDYTAVYTDNESCGTATVTVTAIGNYAGERTVTFPITCVHDYHIMEHKEPTCAEPGYDVKACSICGVVLYPQLTVTEGLPESPHNYGNSMNEMYTYTAAGFSDLEIVFSSQTQTESGYDRIYIYDGNDTLIGNYTGTALASQTVHISGDTVKIKLTSDGSVTYYGFSLVSITATNPQVILPPLPHTESEWIVDTPARWGVGEGSRHKECTECHTVLVTEEIPLILGDANGDGTLDDADLEVYRRQILAYTGGEFDWRLDANGDGALDVRDMVRLKRHLASDPAA